MTLSELVNSSRVYLDGAMGSELIARGLDTTKAELYNLSQPEIIFDIHKKYLDAGSNIIYTNTFGCNQLKYNVSTEKLSSIIKNGIKIAKKAVFGRTNSYVAYSVGPLTELIQPFGKLTFDESYQYFCTQAQAVNNSDADLVVIETFTDPHMLKSAILAFKENTNLPIWCSMSFDENGRTFNGCSVACFALIAQGLNVDAIGINCSLGPDKMFNNAKELIKYAHLPIFIKPNAGLPVFKNGKTSYDITSSQFTDYMLDIAKTGISILGGCCGTTPEYIKNIVNFTKSIKYKIFNNYSDAICSSTTVVNMNSDLPLVIGERVNPTGKPLLKQALLNDNFDYIISMCVDQIDKGAKVLDINVGMGGIDETEKLANVISSIQGAVACPIQIDSSRLTAIEKALRIVNGIPIINSVNGDDESLDSILPLAKKYGAYVVGLCLDKNGIPETVDGRLSVADKIINRGKFYDIPPERFLIDALTLAVSVDIKNSLITLDTVKALKHKGIKTVLGLSNISYGLPSRDTINNAFYKMALENGLFAVIANPTLKPLSNKFADQLLSGYDVGCKNYVEKFINHSPKQEQSQSTLTIYDCIIKGLKTDGLNIVKADATFDNYNSIIQDDIIGGLNEIGNRYDKGQVFLPQLISSAECATTMLDYIKTHFMSQSTNAGKTMLIATVKGDIHDIGKNIVKAVLSNYGYNIFDLGKDVDIKAIIDAISSHKPEIIGLSALMTTTLDNMKLSVDAIKAHNKNIIIIVGGAVVTEEYAKAIGADIYASDAQDAVKKLDKYFSKQ